MTELIYSNLKAPFKCNVTFWSPTFGCGLIQTVQTKPSIQQAHIQKIKIPPIGATSISVYGYWQGLQAINT